MTVIGVSDPDRSRAEEVAAKARCPAFSDYREMCARLRPDFAFALGRHCDMADEARFLIAERIPFAMEKPCAITAADAHDIAARAAQAELFAAVPFVIRYSKLIDTIREVAAGEAVLYVVVQVRRRHGRPLPRTARRMDAASRDRRRRAAAQSRRALPRPLPRAAAGHDAAVSAGAVMSNHLARLDIEDHAVVLMRGGGATCVVETGYLYPAPNSVFDLHYSIRTEGHHFAARDNQTLEILDNQRRREVRSMPLTNSFFYPTFVEDTLRRLAHGEKPIADLSDMAAAMDLVEAAYASGAPAGSRPS